MRHSTLALFALLSSASAFAPAKISTTHRSQSSLHAVKNDNNNNQFGNQIEDAKNAFLGTVTAATILMGTMAPLPDAANAATAAPAAPAAATATKTAPAKKADPVAAPAPLAAEKAAVASAKAAFTASQKVSVTTQNSSLHDDIQNLHVFFLISFFTPLTHKL